MIKIPIEKGKILTKILNLTKEEQDRILNEFKALEPNVLCLHCAFKESSLIKESSEWERIFMEFTLIFSSLYSMKKNNIISDLDEFLDIFMDSFEFEYYSNICKEDPNPNSDLKLKNMKIFLKSLLTSNDKINVIERASNLNLDREKILRNTRIITDFRPVFKEGKINVPVNGVIIHTLKISFKNSKGKEDKTYIALDRQDLISLRKTVDRALSKEIELQKFFSNSKVTILGDKHDEMQSPL